MKTREELWRAIGVARGRKDVPRACLEEALADLAELCRAFTPPDVKWFTLEVGKLGHAKSPETLADSVWVEEFSDVRPEFFQSSVQPVRGSRTV